MATRPRTVLPAANGPSSVMRNQVPNSFASAIARHTRERGAWSTTRFSIRSVLIVVLQPIHDAVLFLPAERREIEQVVGVEQMVEAALVGRIGVEDALAVARDAKVGVEIGPERRQPGKCPSHALLEGFDFCEWRARDRSECRVARGEMDEATSQVIDDIRAGRAPLVLPLGRETKHEMVDDELALLAE